jgi:alkylhydroperoxidase/carboxymuconolactone decarboxylase family protein YurZ
MRGGPPRRTLARNLARITERNPVMTVPTQVNVDEATRQTLSGVSTGDVDLLEAGLRAREQWQQDSGLDPRSFSLVKIAALVALDAPPASYLWQVANALDSGATPNEIVGVLRAIAPQVGGPRCVAAAPEIMVALGLSLPEGA